MDDPLLQNTGVFGIAEDQHMNLWFATWKGIFKYDRAKARFHAFDLSDALSEPHVWSIFVDSKSQIWAGTEGGGICIFKEDQGQQLRLVMRLQHGGVPMHSLSDNRIYSIFEDSNHEFWIGTGNGLDHYDPKTGVVKHLSPQSALWPKGTIAGITEDQKGFLWVSHKQGISRIDRRSLRIRTFSKQDGLQSNEFAEGAVYRSRRTNRLYFGGNKGVSYFNPDSIRTNPTPPRVVFTELRVLNEVVEVGQQVNDRVVLRRPLYLSESLNLTHEDKSISITFAALHYANPAGNKYAYMLEGFDKDWIYTDATKRVASYSNLTPGDYIFKVKASNSDGIWTTTPTALPIAVAPAIWASKWAYLLYACIFLILLYAFYYYIRRYTRLKSKLAYEALLHEKERELHESKLQFFTNISHEIKTPLSLILSPIQQLKGWSQTDGRIQEQLQTMENNGNRLLRTVNQLLDIRRFETGHETLHLEYTDIILLIKKVIASFAQEAKQKNIRLKTDLPLSSLFVDIDADKIEKVLYNLLSNALKFTGSGGIIKIRITLRSEQLILDVIDNGSSIPTDDLERIFKPFLQGQTTVSGGTGLGLTYSKSLVEMHRGALLVQSRSHATSLHLTLFRMILPLERTQPPIDSAREEWSMPQQGRATYDVQHENVTTSVDKQSLPKRCTLLFVEDNAEMRHYLANYFSTDYDILEAANGEIGLQLARKHVPDLIISDVMMPRIDGISFTRQIKLDILLRHIPVILLTARTCVEYEIEGLETGADDYMVKPFHLPILALKVRNQLLAHFRMQEKYRHKVSIEPSTIDVQS